MRKAGILLHISSLSGDYGSGTFGKEAYAFADALAEGGFSIWQVLPFNIPCRTACPYSSASTFAGNPLFIDPDILCDEGLLTEAECDILREYAAKTKDLYLLAQHREKLLRRAAARAITLPLADEIFRYVNANPRVKEACRYLAMKDGDEEANFFYHAFVEYEFRREWDALHAYIRERGIEVIGDIPIYVDADSSERYFHPECFLQDENGSVSFVSGVPGDDFAPDGQKWGHPLYDTAAMAAQDYALLFDRMAFAASLYDVTRIDHFQAIAAYFAIPADGTPAEGEWRKGVGEPFVRRLADELGRHRFVVEDFDLYPGGAHALAVKYGFPDMNILQFTLKHGGRAADYPEKTVAYTGTHDNDTLLGFLSSLDDEERARIAALLGTDKTDGESLADAAILSLLASRAERVVFPAQDILRQDGRYRMNVPGVAEGNWTYRLTAEDMPRLCSRLADIKPLLLAHHRMEE